MIDQTFYNLPNIHTMIILVKLEIKINVKHEQLKSY